MISFIILISIITFSHETQNFDNKKPKKVSFTLKDIKDLHASNNCNTETNMNSDKICTKSNDLKCNNTQCKTIPSTNSDLIYAGPDENCNKTKIGVVNQNFYVLFPANSNEYKNLENIITKKQKCGKCFTCKKSLFCSLNCYDMLKEILLNYKDWSPPTEVPENPDLNMLLYTILKKIVDNFTFDCEVALKWMMDAQLKHLINPKLLFAIDTAKINAGYKFLCENDATSHKSCTQQQKPCSTSCQNNLHDQCGNNHYTYTSKRYEILEDALLGNYDVENFKNNSELFTKWKEYNKKKKREEDAANLLDSMIEMGYVDADQIKLIKNYQIVHNTLENLGITIDIEAKNTTDCKY